MATSLVIGFIWFVRDLIRGYRAMKSPTSLAWLSRWNEKLIARRDPRGVREAQEKLLTRSIRWLGNDSRLTLSCMALLSDRLEAEDRLSDAVEIREQVLANIRARFGFESPWTLYHELKCASLLIRLDQPEGALPLLQHVVHGYRNDPEKGDDHADALLAMLWLGECLRQLGEFATARQILGQVIARDQQKEAERSALADRARIILDSIPQGDS